MDKNTPSNQPEIERLEKEIQVLKEKVDTPKPKDTWDKLSSISILISGIIIALIGTVATITYNTRQQDLQKIQAEAATQIQQVQTVEKFFSHLISKDESERKAALEILALLGNEVMVTRLALTFRDDASSSMLMKLEDHPDPEVRKAASKAVERLQFITVGVLDFENVGENQSLAGLAKMISRIFMTNLVSREDIRVVERMYLDILSDLVDSETPMAIGKLYVAQTLLYGGVFRLRNQIYVNGHLYRVETGELIASVGGNAPDSDWIGMVKNLSPEIEVAIGRYKSALLADLWYNKARKAQRSGNHLDAMQMYAKALKFDSSRISNKLESQAREMNRITLAVLPFEVVGESKELMALQKGLMDLFITALYKKIPQLQIIEHQRLNYIFDELALSQDELLIDPETYQRPYKLLVPQLKYSGKLVYSSGRIEITGELHFIERNALIASATGSCALNQISNKLPVIIEDISTEISDFVKKVRPF